ncbi:MAG: HNH endonuclease, partial [Pseudomonas sp.]
MELNNKEQWRAFLAKGMAEYESEDGRINDSPASVEQYAQALREIEVDITFKQKQMLIGHALAPGQILTMTELASLADGEGFQVANSQYGALGKRLTQALGLAKPAWWVYTLASFEDGPDSKKRLAHMHTPLRDALEQLGWLPT